MAQFGRMALRFNQAFIGSGAFFLQTKEALESQNASSTKKWFDVEDSVAQIAAVVIMIRDYFDVSRRTESGRDEWLAAG